MSDDTLIEQARESLTAAIEHWQPIYQKAKEDLYFMSDEEGAQWDATDYKARLDKRRPTLTIDQLGQFVNHVSNDIRMNTPTINIQPTGGDATILKAEILKGLIRDIEQESKADIAYDTAVSFSIESSIGFFRIDHDYVDPMRFEQKLTVNRIVNPHSVYLDPEIIEPDGSDATVGHVVEVLTRDEFTARWPDKEPIGFECSALETLPDDDHLYVLEYFYIEEKDATLYRLVDGTTGVIEGQPDPATMQYVQMTRPTTLRTVHRCWLSGVEKLEATTSPGKYIPLIPVFGKESWRDGKRHLESLIRKSKDSQRMYNYWKSMETELLMKQPKAPIIAAEGSIEDHARSYTNPDGQQVLLYKPYDEQNKPLPAPQLGNVPRIPDGVILAGKACVDDIKATMGMYGASIGQQTNEVSGKAIQARKQEGDRATFHFGDNLVRSVAHAGRVLLSAIPDIYNTPRIVSVIGKEDTSEMIGINGAVVPGQQQTIDLTKTDEYGVTVTTGAPFNTMREEAAEYYKQIVMTTPDMMPVIGDLVFKYQDFPGAQAISDRLRRTVPPHLLGEEQQGPTPEQQQIAQMEQALQALQAENAQLEQELKAKVQEVQVKAQTELAKNDTEKQKQQVEVMRLSLEREQARADHAIQQQEIRVKQEELDLKRKELSLKLTAEASADRGQPL